MGIFSFLFGTGASSLKKALKQGAIIIDVRTPRENDNGRIPESINIPLERIAASEQRIKGMDRPVIFCCTDGSRSKKARDLMAARGMKNVYAGGNWMKLLELVKSL